MSEWQPIETMPDDQDVLLFWDGQIFIGWHDPPHDDGVEQYPGKFMFQDEINLDESEFVDGNERSGVDYLEDDEEDEGPTHWMPLPAPPENKS